MDNTLTEIQNVQNEIDNNKVFIDPVEYVENFRQSEQYKKGFANFKSGKTYSEDYPYEMRDLFESDEKARLCLIHFAEDEDVMLDYKKNIYSGNSSEINPLDEYFSLLKHHVTHQDQYDAIGYDQLRGSYHDRARNYIMKKFNIARDISIGLVQIMAIKKGLESFGLAKENRYNALARTL
ncbi:MAG TPA: hypothetical protein PLI45_01005 [Candidatus Woesebacteria bacterium]|nr:hypothetical protein [Candidatus Woesebacteria bacterium]